MNTLAEMGVRLSVRGEQLECFAQKGTLTKDIESAIARHKPALIRALRGGAQESNGGAQAQPAAQATARFPLSAGQRSHYLLQQLNPGRSFAVHICLKVRKRMDLEVLDQAWDAVGRRFPILSARIETAGDQLVQSLDPARLPRIRRRDVQIDDDQLLGFLQDEIARPFDLERGPLVRIDWLSRRADDAILLIVVHHLVFDGYSIGLLLGCLFQYYRDLLAGKQLAPPSRPGYRAFVSWESAMLESGAGQAHAEYWRKRLDGAPSAVKLLSPPTGASSPEEPKVLIRRLDPQLAQRVRALCREELLTPAAVFLALFNILLHKHTQQSDVVILMPAIVRPTEDLAAEVGYLFNVVPIRTQIDAHASAAALMREVQCGVFDGLLHRVYPFSLMLGNPRARQFNLFYAFQDAVKQSDPIALALGSEFGLEYVQSLHQRAEGDFDLALEVFEEEETFRVHLQGNPGLYGNLFLETLLDRYLTLARESCGCPRTAVAELSMLDAAERQLVVEQWNATRTPYPVDRCTHQLFEELAQTDPQRAAVSFGAQTLTYGELSQRTETLAIYLQSLGVGPDEVVGLCLEQSLEMMTGILGVTRAGAAYLPLDPSYPEDRLEYMLCDSGARIVLTQARFAGKLAALAGSSARRVVLDADWPEIAAHVAGCRERGVRLRRDVAPHNVNYVIYTSGSTGKPKGVLVEHRALVNRLAWMQKSYRLGSTDVVLQKTPYGFDVSVWEFFWPMMYGASLVFTQPEGRTDVHHLEEIINARNVTALHFVPSMLHVFLDNARGICPGVRLIFCSGEALDLRSAQRYRERFPNATLHNLYGPTEAAIDVTYYDCSRLSYPFVPIGRPVDNTQIYILDEGNRPQPIGVPGELHIAGDNLARGYLNRPELTRERFVSNPFVPDRRMYKTGDLACWLPDGNIQYLGRIDKQVKINGVRIETGEIEAHLDRHPAVAESVVLARGPDGYKQLIAFYRAHGATAGHTVTLSHRELREYLMLRLPEYMIPAGFIGLGTIPLSSNGKADRGALERLDVALEASQDYRPPTSEEERQLCELWREVFREHGFLSEERPIGVNDDFFELGGNSILATQLLYKIRWHFRVNLPVRALFEKPSVAQIAGLIAAAEKGGLLPPEPPVDMEAEAALDPTIDPLAAQPGVGYGGSRSVLLTGATGFLGAYLLRDLLAHTDATVHCLVRCGDEKEGRARIRAHLEKCGLWRHEVAQRIVAVPGDLGRPLLGLGTGAFRELSETIDTIIHNGALVNFIYPYATLRSVNVRGTEEVIRLASVGRRKPLHYISTGSVFPSALAQQGAILEAQALTDGQQLAGGYAQSKWVAERLAAIARERGLPVRVYRPGTVSGDSVTGTCSLGDFLPRLIKGCIQLGAAPDSRVMIGMAPVDYVSRAIVHLSAREEADSPAFHLVNPHRIAASELGGLFAAAGYRVAVMPYRDWREALLESARSSTSNELYPLLSLFTEETPLEQEPVLDCRATLAGLKDTDIRCPRIDVRLIGAYLRYFRESGFLADGPADPIGVAQFG